MILTVHKSIQNWRPMPMPSNRIPIGLLMKATSITKEPSTSQLRPQHCNGKSFPKTIQDLVPMKLSSKPRNNPLPLESKLWDAISSPIHLWRIIVRIKVFPMDTTRVLCIWHSVKKYPAYNQDNTFSRRIQLFWVIFPNSLWKWVLCKVPRRNLPAPRFNSTKSSEIPINNFQLH
jgi:hypothetical protein